LGWHPSFVGQAMVKFGMLVRRSPSETRAQVEATWAHTWL